MNVRAQALRIVFATSVLLTAFWVVGFVWEPVFGRDAPISILGFLGVAIAAAISWAAFRGGRFVLPPQTPIAEAVRAVVPRVIGAYFISVPVVGVAVWLLVRAFADTSSSDAGVAVPLMALWLPLWFAPAVGIAWSRRSTLWRETA